nr:hypothetical protein [uncultured Methanobrevibacter sp.]
MPLINDDEKAHNPSSRKLGNATLKISTSIYRRNLKYFLDNGIFVLPFKYRNTKIIKGISEDKTVAYDAPLTPKFKLKIKIGSNIIFKIFEDIMNMVGILEFPSACKVSEKKLTNMNIYAKAIIGIKYSRKKDVLLTALR